MTPDNTQRRRLKLRNAPPLIYVVGDVHGCLALYKTLETKIIADAQTVSPDTPLLIVLLGDLVDRGANSAQMLDLILGPAPDTVTRLALAGNHEDMFLNFLRHPKPDAPWLDYGGRETLNSYGIYPTKGQRFDTMSRHQLAVSIAATVPEEHINALEKMPASLRLPGFLICHAGINVHVPLNEQTDRDLLWSNPADLDITHQDSDPPAAILDLVSENTKVVHGHVPANTAFETSRRVSIDTGAYQSGILSAVRLNQDTTVDFLIASSRQ